MTNRRMYIYIIAICIYAFTIVKFNSDIKCTNYLIICNNTVFAAFQYYRFIHISSP